MFLNIVLLQAGRQTKLETAVLTASAAAARIATGRNVVRCGAKQSHDAVAAEQHTFLRLNLRLVSCRG